jgi:hypothetical protein
MSELGRDLEKLGFSGAEVEDMLQSTEKTVLKQTLTRVRSAPNLMSPAGYFRSILKGIISKKGDEGPESPPMPPQDYSCGCAAGVRLVRARRMDLGMSGEVYEFHGACRQCARGAWEHDVSGVRWLPIVNGRLKMRGVVFEVMS